MQSSHALVLCVARPVLDTVPSLDMGCEIEDVIAPQMVRLVPHSAVDASRDFRQVVTYVVLRDLRYDFDPTPHAGGDEWVYATFAHDGVVDVGFGDNVYLADICRAQPVDLDIVPSIEWAAFRAVTDVFGTSGDECMIADETFAGIVTSPGDNRVGVVYVFEIDKVLPVSNGTRVKPLEIRWLTARQLRDGASMSLWATAVLDEIDPARPAGRWVTK